LRCIFICSFFFCSIQEAYQNKREQYMANLQKKEETIRQTFVQKVKDKENELKKAEQEVRPT